MFHLSSEYSLGWSILCLILGFLFSYFLYKRSDFSDKKALSITLFVLRVLTVSILAFFLLKPYLNTLIVEREKPIIALGIDNSSSILSAQDNTSFTADFQNKIDQINEVFADDYQLDIYTLGQETKLSENLSFNDKRTNISSFLEELNEVYSNRNLSAVILASDGLYNTGSNPLYVDYPFKAPLHILALGDTTVKSDVKINHVFHNELAFLGNTFPVNVNVNSRFFANKSTSVGVYKGLNLVSEQKIYFQSENQDQTVSFKLVADEQGVQEYSIKVKPIKGEEDVINNIQKIYIDVLESRQKILLLSEIVHPDISSISAAISSNDNYELTVLKKTDFNGDYSPYSLVIAFQTEIENKSIPVFYFWGNNTKSQSLEWLNFKAYNADLAEVTTAVSPFSMFCVDKQWDKWTSQLPPLYSPFGEYTFNSDHQVLFHQNMSGVSTERPLLCFSNSNGVRQAVWAGEGLWKWRLFEYKQNKNHKLFDELINKSVQFLAVKEDKRQFRIRFETKIYENENFILDADLYNSNYELINDPEVSLTFTDRNADVYNYTLSKKGDSYSQSVKDLSIGSYQFEVSTSYAGKQHIRKGKLQVIPLQLEQMETRANHQLLYSLSDINGGDMYYLEQFSSLIDQLSQTDKTIRTYSKNEQSDLIHSKWIAFLLFVFLSLEWFLRKRNNNI